MSDCRLGQSTWNPATNQCTWTDTDYSTLTDIRLFWDYYEAFSVYVGLVNDPFSYATGGFKYMKYKHATEQRWILVNSCYFYIQYEISEVAGDSYVKYFLGMDGLSNGVGNMTFHRDPCPTDPGLPRKPDFPKFSQPSSFEMNERDTTNYADPNAGWSASDTWNGLFS